MKNKIIVAILIAFSLTGCVANNNSQYNSQAVQQIIQQSEIVDVTVTDINYQHWYASGHHYTCDITVHCNKYNIDDTFHLTDMDAMEYEDTEVNDVIQADVIIQKDNNGNIIKSYINDLE